MATMSSVKLEEIAAELRGPYAMLRRDAEMYADQQDHRVKMANAAGLKKDKSGNYVAQRAGSDISVGAYAPIVRMLDTAEHKFGVRMVKRYRKIVPQGVIEWEKRTPGIGEPTLARLLGHTGHPRLADPFYWADNDSMEDGEFGDLDNPKRKLIQGEPFLRMVSQLWQYCGHGRAERRRKGMTQEEAMYLGSPKCKMLVFLLSQGVIKAQVRSDPDAEYREMSYADRVPRVSSGQLGAYYLDERAKYSARVHTRPCSGGPVVTKMPDGSKRTVFVKCKVVDSDSTKYAEIGDPYQASHINAIGMRHLGKEILKQLYDAAYEDWC